MSSGTLNLAQSIKHNKKAQLSLTQQNVTTKSRSRSNNRFCFYSVPAVDDDKQ